ncbi:MAG: hypothetical protein HQM12_05510 [SAR324 cluster bacterium]|nr:hypothetical protein [SAR324 cluster bacterium]
MKYFFLILGMLCLGMSLVSGAEPPRKMASTEYYVVGVSPLIRRYEGLSATPLRFGMFVNQHDMMGLETGSGTFRAKSEGDTKSLDYSTLGVYYRFFLGDALNAMAGFFQRVISGNMTFKGDDVTPSAQTALSVETNLIGWSVGHQWLFEGGAVLGVDWVYGSALIYHNSSVSIQTSSLTVERKATIHKRLQSIADNAIDETIPAGVLMMTFGLSF